MLVAMMAGATGRGQRLKNSSFENLTGTVPTNWTKPYANNYEGTTTSASFVYKGGRAFRIADTGTSAGDVGGLRSDPIPITPGKKYIASVRCYLNSGSGVSLYLEYRNAAGTKIEEHIATQTKTGSWEVLTVVPEDGITKQVKAAPATATNVTLLIYSGVAQDGTSYWDNAMLTEVDSMPVDNGGFEAFTGSLPDDWTTPYGNGYESSSTTRAYAGSRSLKIADPSSTLPGGMRSGPIPVIPGRFYSAKAKVYIESGANVSLALDYWNVEGNRVLTYKEDAIGTGAWKTVVVTPFQETTKALVDAPYGASYATITAYTTAGSTATAYFDVVELLTDEPGLASGGLRIENSGFEQVDGSGFPTGWTKYGTSGFESGSTASADSGTRSVLINDNSTTANAGVQSMSFPVVEGRRYVANLRANVTAGQFSLYVRYFDNETELVPVSYTDDEYLGADVSPSIAGTSGWSSVSFEFTPPFLAKYARLLIYSSVGSTGTGYFDSVSVAATSEGLSNGSFEEWSLAGYPHGWSGHLNSANIATAGSDVRVKEAARSLVIVDTSSSEGGGARSNRILGPSGVGIVSGAAYTASAQVYLESGALDLYVEYWNSAGTRIGYNTASLTTTGSWQPIEVSEPAPTGTAYATVLLYSPVSTANTIAYVDDVKFRKAVLPVGGQRQLFIDDYVVQSTASIQKIFHQAQRSQPVVEPDPAYENNVMNMYGSFLYDASAPSGEQYRLYYIGDGYTRLLVSGDGDTWTRKNLTSFTPPGKSKSNVVVAYDADSTMQKSVGLSIAIDPNETDPDKRYKAFAKYFKEPAQNDNYYYRTYFSADGYTFHDPVTHLAGYDVATMAFDPSRNGFVGAVKIFDNGRRVHRIATSPDAATWSVGVRAETISDTLDIAGPTGDLDFPYFQDADSYGLGWYPYEGVYIGFSWIFQIKSGLENAPGDQNGDITPQLVFARNLAEGWTRPNPDREPLFPADVQNPPPGGGVPARTLYNGVTYTASQAVTVNDEVRLYFGAFDGGHGTGSTGARIFLAKWRLDGFASLHAGATEGTVLTRKLTFAGSSLKVNVNSVGTGNYLKAELLDSSGNVISGYSAAQCVPINADNVNATVSWSGGSNISALAGQTIQIRFYLKNSDLYAFEFQ